MNYDIAYARNDDPDTSHEAAGSINVAKLEAIVLTELQRLGYEGATSEELAIRTGLSRVTVSPRLRPLCDKGLVYNSLLRRKGASGRSSIVWRAV